MSELSKAFSKIATLYPEAIRPGLTPEQIDEYLDEFPAKIPEEFYELYQLSDGLNHSNSVPLFFGFGRLHNLTTATEIYHEIKNYPGYYSRWLPIMTLEHWIYVIRGDAQQRKTAPIIRFDDGDLIFGNDWEPEVVYSSLTDMIMDYVDEIESF